MVCLRFAPSPTGYLHIGNARAAIINYLFSKKNNGKFILRIDDTDNERSKKRYEDAIFKDLEWLGIEYHETFRQSERFDKYIEVRDKLIEKNWLYPCYETTEELEFKRKRLLTKKLPPVYDRASLELTTEQVRTYEKEGRKPHWRFKLKHETIKWHDLIRGDVSFDAAQISDPVLIRADGQFLYSLCSVVDDIDFNITHIVRGEDHVTNTATQIQLFEAVHGAPYPLEFAHTSLLMDEDGRPLSKRIGSLSLNDMKAKGIEPMAINSLLARLGTSMPVEPLLNIQDLVTGFDLAHFSRTPPKFSIKDLSQLNHKLYLSMPFSEVKNRLTNIGCSEISQAQWDLIKENIETLDDVVEWEKIFFDSSYCPGKNGDLNYKNAASKHLPSAPLTLESWQTWTNAIKESTGLKGKNLFQPLRQLLTGKDRGPEMPNLLPLIHYNVIQARCGQ